MIALDPHLTEAYVRDGVVCVRGVLDPEQIEQAVRGIHRVLDEPSSLAQVASAAGDPGRFSEDFCRWTDVPEIGELAQHSRVPAIAAALMATDRVRLYHDHVLVKEGGTSSAPPGIRTSPITASTAEASAPGFRWIRFRWAAVWRCWPVPTSDRG